MIRSATRPARAFAFALALPLLGALLFTACDGGDSPATPAPAPAPSTPAPAPTPAPPAPDETATYDIAYTAKISSDATLIQLQGATPFPDGVGSAPFVALIMHPVDTTLWEEGGIASDGLKVLAETGASADFIAEAEAMGYVAALSTSAELGGLLLNPELTLSHAAPCVTFAQMIAPSPDWFFGFSSVCAVDDDGNWLDEVTLTSVAYDAGTAEGETFALKAEGGDTDPRDPITELDMAPFSPAGTPLSEIVATRRSE